MSSPASSSGEWSLRVSESSLQGRAHRFFTRRRIQISIVVFGVLLLVNLFVRRIQPVDLLDLSNPLSAIGLALLACGLLIRSWAAGTLHKIKTLTNTGIYALVRNPLYVGSFLMMFGFCALLADWLTLAVVAGPLVLMYWAKVRDEEAHLARLFPQDWPHYAAATPRFIPRLALPTAAGFSAAQWLHHKEYQAAIASLAALLGLYFWRLWW